VTVTWSVSDNESTIGTQSGCGAVTISTDTGGQTVTCDAASAGGTSSESVTITRDATPPVLSPAVSPSPVLLNGTASATPNASDATSGVATQTCGAVATGTPGPSAVVCTATDNAGNVGTVSTNYSVVYRFTGFSQPVDNLPTRNLAKAGSAIPLKFGLGGNQGLGIFAAGSPSWQQVACSPGAVDDGIEQTVTAGASSLSYDAVAQQYVYVWKTDKTWSGTCVTLTVKLIDGTTRQASFKFN
jgi:hypothetical protein